MSKLYLKIVIFTIILTFVLGLIVGYLSPRDINLQIIESSKKYFNYFKVMNQYIHPFNETDNVTMFYHSSTFIINHTTPNEYGIRFFDIGFDNDGSITYIAQIRNRD